MTEDEFLDIEAADFSDPATAVKREQDAQNSSNSDTGGDSAPVPALVFPSTGLEVYKGRVRFRAKKIAPNFLKDSGADSMTKAKGALSNARKYIAETYEELSEISARVPEGLSEAEKQQYIAEQNARREQLMAGLTADAKEALGFSKRDADGNLVDADQSADEAARKAFNILSASGRPTEDVDPVVDLYLPVSLNIADNFGYDTPSLGVTGALAANTVANGGSLFSSVGQSVANGINSIVDLALGNQTGTAARLGLVRATKSLPDEIKFGAQLGASVTMNPHIRTMFRNVGLREFAFQFKFIPKSYQEAQTVESIIKTFRKSAYPVSIGGEDLGISLGYEYPDLFEIIIEFDGVPVGTRLKLCHLRGVSTNYNPSSMAFHNDGKPVEIDLTLNFIEEMTLDRADIEAGF